MTMATKRAAAVLALALAIPSVALPADPMSAQATATLVGTRPGRPPLERLLLDVTLVNESAVPRWALIPANLPGTPGGVDKLEQRSSSASTSSVTIGRLLGRAGRYAILLAPGARLTLRKLEVGWWGDKEAKELRFDVEFADDVRLGEETIASWFDKDATVRGAADLDMQTARHAASHRAPGDKEVPVSMMNITRAPIRLRMR